jgi:hypothetical protein
MVIPFAQDINILVTSDGFEQFHPEDIKKCVVDADGRYYLRRSRKPGAKYKVLFCRLPGFQEGETSCQRRLLYWPRMLC